MFYGPVLSRRFGYSLGIDIIPHKVCVYDCIYCQLGRTTKKTLERNKYMDIDYREFEWGLKDRVKACPHLNYVTFSGSGEPTLNIEIGNLIKVAKEATDIPVAVLTSGGTLLLQEVREDIREADIIKVSLDGPDGETLRKINRPAKGVSFEKNIEGLKNLTKIFGGRIWLEIMVMDNINDSSSHAHKFKQIVEGLSTGIEKIHLNTAVRPAGIGYMKLPDTDRLEKFKYILGEKAEIIGKVDYKDYSSGLKNMEKEVAALIDRRPSSVADIAKALGFNLNEVIKICDKMLNEGKIKYSLKDNNRYVIPKEKI
ncbi:MAG: radical SAM protein [Actinomycetota bacterium]